MRHTLKTTLQKEIFKNFKHIKKITVALCILMLNTAIAQEKEYTTEDITLSNLIEGTLLIPESEAPKPLVIIIQGSGPTDRDGNQPNMRNNSLKYLAEELGKNGIASFRYDKRLVKLAIQGRLREEDIDFDHFIDDAILVIEQFKDDSRFSHHIIIGHSEGSLVGMIAANNRADAFISIAGAGQVIDDLIVDQLKRQAPYLADDARRSFDDLRENGVALDYGEFLSSIFRPSVQPFMRTWMQYDPKQEIAKLDIPVMIINGTEDVQVDENEARLLHKAKPLAEMYLIENMNHVLKEIASGDTIENGKSYNEPQRPVMPELIEKITTFIQWLDN